MLPLLLAAALAAPPEPLAKSHDEGNPLYKELRDPGLLIGPDLRAKLPPPVVADGLDGPAQKAAIVAFLKGDSWDEFTRRSVVAPSVLRVTAVTPSSPAAPARLADVGFVVYGDLKATEDRQFLDRLLNTGKGGGSAGKAITPADLAKRKITPGPGEGFGRVEFDFLDRVRLGVTGRSLVSRTADSVVAAAAIDPRFAGDAEFPNEWRSLTKEGGRLTAGPPQPGTAAGLYLKVTRLADPPGALFVEQHVAFTEPTGWFDGANLLGSKLPLVVQDNVRKMRREWLKAGGG